MKHLVTTGSLLECESKLGISNCKSSLGNDVIMKSWTQNSKSLSESGIMKQFMQNLICTYRQYKYKYAVQTLFVLKRLLFFIRPRRHHILKFLFSCLSSSSFTSSPSLSSLAAPHK